MKKLSKSITILVICIAALSLAASLYGLLSGGGPGEHQFKSINGETVQIYGKGLYQNDSVSVAAQGKSQDIVTIFLAIPVLIISLFMAVKGSLKGRLLLAGTLGYFLYTYISYAFLWNYNSMFLPYVMLMAASLYAFILTMVSFEIESLKICFKEKMPVKLIGGFLIFIAAALGLMWLGKIGNSLTSGTPPVGMEHYTTLVIQGMDLGLIVPAALVAAVMVIKRKPFGYILASVIVLKGLSMATAVTAMLVGQILAGINVSLAEMVLFPLMNLIILYCMYLIMKNINEPKRRTA